jgi:hypothetical protein
MLQIGGSGANADGENSFEQDLDVVLGVVHEQAVAALLNCITATLSQRYQPKLASSGNVRFQLTRGELGVSL